MSLAEALQLPAGAARTYLLKSPWKEDAGRAVVHLNATETHTFELAPFEVLNLEMKAGAP